MKKCEKKLSVKFTKLVLIIAVLASILMLWCIQIIPVKWKLAATAALAVLALVSVLLTRQTLKSGKQFMKVVNIVLAVILLSVSCLLPYYQSRVTRAIRIGNEAMDPRAKIHLYMMRDVLKEDHPDIYARVNKDEELNVSVSDEELKELVGQYTVITNTNQDKTNQKEAVGKLDELTDNTAKKIDADSVMDAADKFMNNEGQMLLINASFMSLLSGTEGYENLLDQVVSVYTIYIEHKEQTAEPTPALVTGNNTFSVFIGGNDQEGKLSDSGRTDVDIVVTMNPNTHDMLITSFPRDSFIANPALDNQPDKLTYLGVMGIKNTVEGLSKVLDTDIDYYVLVNFTTYRKIINAVGGVDVFNPYSFSVDGKEFAQGEIHLNGKDALNYVRERHSLPDGDFGRNQHQQLVLSALIRKILSPSMIVNFSSLLNALNGTFLTNLSSDQIYAMAQKQLADNPSWHMRTYQIKGLTGSEYTASMPGRQLSVVYPYAQQIEFVAEQIDHLENNEQPANKALPEDGGDVYQP